MKSSRTNRRRRIDRLPFFSLILLVLIFFSGAPAPAEEEIDPFETMGWVKLESLPPIETISREDGSAIPIEVHRLEDLSLSEPNHLVAGEIRYRDVKGDGFLEMWTVYSANERYFSRTLGLQGPMAKLNGTSEWRLVMLPFQGSLEKTPRSLELNLVLPGGGKVEFRNFALYEAPSPDGGAWFPPNKVGTVVTPFLAGSGLLVGISALLGSLGRSRRLVFGLIYLALAIGLVALVTGLVAFAMGQPTFISISALLSGGLVALLATVASFFLRRAYTTRELRAIAAGI
ncbi:MAG: hypothetical protein AAGC68_11485 [Verrucomicrobiota bacterium]